jgi:SAM-dependent methyltransferase
MPLARDVEMVAGAALFVKPFAAIVVVAAVSAPSVDRGRALAPQAGVAIVIQERTPRPAPQRKPPRRPDIFFVPTLESVADEMLKLADVTARDVVYDLGSGDGRILMLAAQKYGARGVGIELDPRLVDLSREVAREGQADDRVSFIEGDLFDADISPATVVTIYLSPGVNARLEPKLRQQLRPGSRIVSHQFPIGRWTPDRTVRADDGTLLYLWTVPPR